jgi:hypothetical protein
MRMPRCSCAGRAADGDPSVIFKDLDIDTRIVLEQGAHEKLMAQLAADCELLRCACGCRVVGVGAREGLLACRRPRRGGLVLACS